MVNAIETVNLSKTYSGGVEALKNLNLIIKKGESFGYLGPNGAGKTTTIQSMLNLITPTKGETYFFGESLTGRENQILRKVGALVEIPGHYDYLTPNDLLTYVCKLYRMSKTEISTAIESTLKRLNISDVRNKKIGTFSTGMKRRISIAQALVHDPELLFLDEPTIGLDPKGVREIRNMVKEMNKEGKTIFLTSHNLTEVAEISSRVVFLRQGKLVRDINLSDLQTQLAAKQIEVKFTTELDSSQKAYVEGIENIIDIEFGKITQISYEGDTVVTNRILKDMMSNDIPVYSFTPRSMTLEDLYLDIYGKNAEVDK